MKNNTKKNTKKIHKKKGGTASKKKSPGKTVKKTPKESRDIRKYNKAQDHALKLYTINRHRTDDDNALQHADNSILRALTRYSGEDVENLSAAQIESIYQNWREIESEARKGHRANKKNKKNEGKGSTPIVRKHTVQRDPDEELSTYAAAAADAADAADALTNMNKYGSNEFSAPGSPTPYTVVDYPSGFTPHDRKRKLKEIDTSISNPRDLFNDFEHDDLLGLMDENL